jgi:peptidyl-prolyl cis-trans isomerase SurA
VIEAESQGYDSVPKLRRELDGYRKQLATPYLIDSAKNEELVKEAYDRMRQEVSASHFMVKLEEDASPADTLIAYNKIMTIRKRIIIKGDDFAAIARRESDDPSAVQNDGYLGYFSAFQMVYPFETAAFNTEVGGVSMPVRTRFGYHLVKVHDKRPARGVITAAHLTIVVKRDADQETKQNAQNRINEIHQKLLAGEAWEDVVSRYSEDFGSKNSGGRLPEFGTGINQRMIPEFEDAAFALKNDGDFSQPIETANGWYIVKRLAWRDVGSFEDLERDIRNRVNKDERALSSQTSFIQKLKKEYNLVESKKQLKWFQRKAKFDGGVWTIPDSRKNPTVFSFSSVQITRSDFADYLRQYNTIPQNMLLKEFISNTYTQYVDQQILAYEEAQLEEKYPAFSALMTEYHDGVLLYEIMNDKVWNKALTDSIGLQNYFNNNRANFMWGNRINADVFVCDSKEIAATVQSLLELGKTAEEVRDQANGRSALNVMLRSKLFEVENTDYLKGRSFTQGINTVYEFKGKYYLVVNKESLPPANKELSDTRGAVTAAYQSYLEQNWIDELMQKYPVQINYDVLYNLDK